MRIRDMACGQRVAVKVKSRKGTNRGQASIHDAYIVSLDKEFDYGLKKTEIVVLKGRKGPVRVAVAVRGNSRMISAGVFRSLMSRMRMSSVLSNTGESSLVAGHADGIKKPPGAWRFRDCL